MEMRDALLETFLAETDELVAELDRSARALAQGGDATVLLEGMFRTAHTLKGNATCLAFDPLTRLTHHLEAALETAMSAAPAHDPSLVPMVLRVLDAVARHAAGCTGGEDPPLDDAEVELCERLSAWTPRPSESTFARAAAAPGASTPAMGPQRTVRIGVAELDRALDLVGELAVARGRAADALARGDRAQTQSSHDATEQLFEDLHQLVLGLRLVPLHTSFERLHRAVRDVAAAAGKLAAIEIRCDDVEVDLALAEALRAPLTHLLRNAIDHGIEAPEARARAGKPVVGRLVLAARREGGTLVVQLSDDGAGMDADQLLERGRRLGVETAGLGEQQVLELAFVPGLTTTDEANDLSGRGIGMDVVRGAIEGLRGSVHLTSRPGQGVTVTLRLPLALSIIQGLAVSVGDEICLLPLDHVVECAELEPDRTTASEDGGLFQLRGDPLPYLDLARRLGIAGRPGGRPSIVVVEQEGQRAGLAVHALHGEVKTVIKPLGRLFAKVSGIAGSAILGDGRVALVVDVRGLLRAAL